MDVQKWKGQGWDENTRRLPYYLNMAEKKYKETALHL